MMSLVVSVRVVPDERQRFLEAITANARSAVRDEPGCVAFEVSEDVAERNHFFLYEVYRDEAAIDAHRATPHYAAWREAASVSLVPDSQVLHQTSLVCREAG